MLDETKLDYYKQLITKNGYRLVEQAIAGNSLWFLTLKGNSQYPTSSKHVSPGYGPALKAWQETRTESPAGVPQ